MKSANSNTGITILLAFSLFIAGGCARQSQGDLASSSTVDSDSQNNIVLEIQENFFTNSDYDDYISLITAEETSELSHDALSRLFDNFVEEKLLLVETRNQNFALSQEEKRTYLAKLTREVKPENGKVAWSENETKVLYERLLIEKFTADLVKNIEVKPEEIEEYYEANKRNFLRPELVKVSQILFSTEDKAVEILERLMQGSEQDFRNIATEISEGIEAVKGGEMGVFQLGQLPNEMEKVIFSLEEGEVSQVVESAYGFHIFRLDKIFQPELISMDEAAPEIEVKILGQKIKTFMSEYMENLKTRTAWDVYTQNLGFPYMSSEHNEY